MQTFVQSDPFTLEYPEASNLGLFDGESLQRFNEWKSVGLLGGAVFVRLTFGDSYDVWEPEYRLVSVPMFETAWKLTGRLCWDGDFMQPVCDLANKQLDPSTQAGVDLDDIRLPRWVVYPKDGDSQKFLWLMPQGLIAHPTDKDKRSFLQALGDRRAEVKF